MSAAHLSQCGAQAGEVGNTGFCYNDVLSAIAPLTLTESRLADYIEGFVQAIAIEDWPAVKQALIAHIEKAIPA